MCTNACPARLSSTYFLFIHLDPMSFSIVHGLKDEWLSKLKTKTDRKVCVYHKKECNKSTVYYLLGDKLVIDEYKDEEYVLITEKSDFMDKKRFTFFLSDENVSRNFNEIPKRYANHLSIKQYYEKPNALNYTICTCNYTPLVSFVHNKRTFYAFMRNNSFYMCINEKKIKGALFVMCINDQKSKSFMNRRNALVILLSIKHVMVHDVHKAAFSFLENVTHDVPNGLLTNAYNTLIMLNEQVQARLRICAFAKIPLMNYSVDSALNNIYARMMHANKMVKNERTEFEWYGTEETMMSGWYENVVEIEIVDAMIIGVKRYGKGIGARLHGFIAKNDVENRCADDEDKYGARHQNENVGGCEVTARKREDGHKNECNSIMDGNFAFNDDITYKKDVDRPVIFDETAPANDQYEAPLDLVTENGSNAIKEEKNNEQDAGEHVYYEKENFFNNANEKIKGKERKDDKSEDVLRNKYDDVLQTDDTNFMEMTVFKKFLKYVANDKVLFNELPRWLIRTRLISKRLKNLIRQLSNDYVLGCIKMINKHNLVLASSKNMIFVHIKDENELKNVMEKNWRILRRFEKLIYLDHDNYFYLKHGDGTFRERIGCNTLYKIPLSFLETAFRGDTISVSYFYGLTKKNVDVLKVHEIYALKDPRIGEIRSNIYKLLGLNEFKIKDEQEIRTNMICISCRNESVLVITDRINKCRRCFNKFDVESVENALIDYIYEKIKVKEYVCESCEVYRDRRLVMECTCGGKYKKVIMDYSFVKDVVTTKRMADYIDDIITKI
ncbi:DNA polymerase epsilon, catalytic subunit A [Trachipleistophora hominis]|uniref:DNA polymerase epsilon, catalytic subunit A n=1 Tax=Trachipleistophora hominis TaxID=72359 RepID=L7JZL0_TRAHO|nr:DNA polymerase epsilon, catalytic subunit A [Trachipleistophora hominis]